jgi:hypothetical protein
VKGPRGLRLPTCVRLGFAAQLHCSDESLVRSHPSILLTPFSLGRGFRFAPAQAGITAEEDITPSKTDGGRTTYT